MKGTLAALQDSWEQWNAAYLLAEEKDADRAVRLLLETAADLGMKGLPDLSLSVLLRSIESAGEQDFDRASWTLAMAERLDPGRPETMFAAAQVAGIEGRYLRKAGYLGGGYLRVFQDSFLLVALRENVLVWILCIALLAGGLLVCLRIGLHGGSVVESVANLLARFLPLALSYILALLATIWPIFLPAGWRSSSIG